MLANVDGICDQLAGFFNSQFFGETRIVVNGGRLVSQVVVATGSKWKRVLMSHNWNRLHGSRIVPGRAVVAGQV